MSNTRPTDACESHRYQFIALVSQTYTRLALGQTVVAVNMVTGERKTGLSGIMPGRGIWIRLAHFKKLVLSCSCTVIDGSDSEHLPAGSLTRLYLFG